jgi:hypothetical protein
VEASAESAPSGWLGLRPDLRAAWLTQNADASSTRLPSDTIACGPGYPEALFGDLEELAGQGPGCRIPEIGCGTGQGP